jgi:HD-GYP domain-containing protein (c-di-GMP phosphodiesterase class II)
MAPPTARDRLLDALRRMERRAAALHEIATCARGAASADDAVRTLLIKFVDLSGAEAGVLALVDAPSNGFDVSAVHCKNVAEADPARWDEARQALRAELADGVLGRVRASGEPARVDAVDGDDRLRRALSAALSFDLRHRLAVPVRIGEDLLGVLELFNKSVSGPFTEEDAASAVELAQQLALALESRRGRRDGGAAGANNDEDRRALEDARRAVAHLEEEKNDLAERLQAAERRGEERRQAEEASRAALRQKEEEATALAGRLQQAEAKSVDDGRRLDELANELARRPATPPPPPETPLGPLEGVFRMMDPLLASGSSEELAATLMALSRRLVDAGAAQLFLAESDGRLRLAGTFPPSDHGAPRNVVVEKGQGLVGRAAESREPLRVADVTLDKNFSRRVDEVLGHITLSALVVPLLHGERMVGVLEVLNKQGRPDFPEADLTVLETLARPAASLFETLMNQEAKAALWRSCVALVSDAVETRGPRGAGRAERLRRLASALGDLLRMEGEERHDLECAALLYNLGRLALPPELVDGGRVPSTEEQELLKQVPLRGAELLSSLKSLAGAAKSVRHVMERWDGEGGPDGKKDEAIPRGARVLAVADAWEHLRTEAPGRRALPPEQALKEIADLSGRAFDPACVEALATLHKTGRLPT